MKRRQILGVVGGGGGSVPVGSATYKLAERVGERIASAGAILLCGGGSGVMEAAAKGAKAVEGGVTLGILPSPEGAGSANNFIDLALHTGLRDGRNYVNAHASDALIALEGGAGTLSEIALGLKLGRPVVALGAWHFLKNEGGFSVVCVDSAAEAVERACSALDCERGGLLSSPTAYPSIPEQSVQRGRFEEFVRSKSPG